MKRFFLLLGLVMLMCSFPLSGSLAASKKQFSDVPSSKHFAAAVYDLAERNIIEGYPDGTFKPGNSITRGQAAAIIAKMMNLDADNVINPRFRDVSTENGYYKAIALLAEKGIINGYGDGNYGPNDPIKRGQMASILVKAFDLPRYPFYETENPFVDLREYESHSKNILILYRLGITTGTLPDKFSPNAFITRGQAAKLIKGTEVAKPTMVTLEANDFGWEELRIDNSSLNNNSGLFKAIEVSGKLITNNNTKNRVQLIPLKEGTGTLILSGNVRMEGSSYRDISKKYYVHIKNENGKLNVTLEETDDYLPTAVELSFWKGSSKSSKEAVESVQNVSLFTMDGKKLSDSVKFLECRDYRICIDLDQPGDYIATVHLTDGKEERFGIEVKLPTKTSFTYDYWTLREQLTVEFDISTFYEGYRYNEDVAKNIGNHKILTKNSDQIAMITREPGTNLFSAVAKRVGTVDIAFQNSFGWILGEPGESMSGVTTGLRVNVRQMGEIINVTIDDIFYILPDM